MKAVANMTLVGTASEGARVGTVLFSLAWLIGIGWWAGRRIVRAMRDRNLQRDFEIR